MSKFTLEITTDNAAFQPEPNLEVASILKGVVLDVEYGVLENGRRQLRDSNGNTVGHYEYTENES